MTYAYVKIGLTLDDILAISSEKTNDIQDEVILDDDAINFSKLEGYVAYSGEDSKNHLKFDEGKYNKYLEKQKKEQIINEGKKLQGELQQMDILNNATDEQAYIMRYLYPEWSADSVTYNKGDRIIYLDKFYKVLQNHTSQADWTPDTASSLYVEIANPTEEWPEFKQPTGAHDAYAKDAKVTFEGKHYKSLIDANVYSPTAYPQGWKLVE